jgi:CheY-like chemotaxis protein
MEVLGDSLSYPRGTAYAVLMLIVNAMKTVLIVEDNESLRELLALIVKTSGYDPATAVTGQDAVEKALTIRPDLILMDIGLPEIDGVEATRRIKATPATKEIPVVILTAFAMIPRGVEGIKAGAAAVLQKPASVAAIKGILTKYTSERPSASL